ncbi:AAA family ATPase [Streptomyces collinus]|uniref:AAA family ATPase n=1 Tax=Streptomyces collinus TaxID=42684 RepID=UPI0033E30A2C
MNNPEHCDPRKIAQLIEIGTLVWPRDLTPIVWGMLSPDARKKVARDTRYDSEDLPEETASLMKAFRMYEKEERRRRLAAKERRAEQLCRATGFVDYLDDDSGRPTILTPGAGTFTFGGADDPKRPTLLQRTDGAGLIYRGSYTHSIAGEPESGKTWLALQVAKEFLATAKPFDDYVSRVLGVDGPVVAYLDYEADREQYEERIAALGIPPERFFYVPRLVIPRRANEVDADQILRLALDGKSLRPVFDAWVTPVSFVIIDDVTKAMSESGFAETNDAVAAWQMRLPNYLAARGITILMLDHLTKANDNTGRYPIGGVAKLAGVSGAQYILDSVKPIRAGSIGETDIRVAKDRPGRVHSHATDWRAYDKTARIGTLVHDATDPLNVSMHISPAGERITATKRAQDGLDQRLLDHLAAVETANMRSLIKEVCSDRTTLTNCLDRLKASGKITEQAGPRGARLFSLSRTV